jgi:ATP/maltotriose-dependent transcriptional regulator MalT
MGVKTFTLRYFEDLFSRLHSRTTSSTPGGFVLVFDNFQEAPEASLLHEVFTEGLTRVPEGVTVVILSRSEPPPLFAPLRANRRMEVIGWDELRLRFEETEGIVRQLRDERISGEILHQMHRKADGWAAGLVLILERAGKESAGAPVHTNPAPQEIFDYFAGEIFERAGAEIQAFLLKTSSFRKFTADMAAELTQNPQAAQKLSDLSRHHSGN